MSSSTILSIVMLAAIVLVLGAIALWRRGASRLQIALMVVLAAVMVINVAIWTVPMEGGASPASADIAAH